ncbi:thioesterase-like superfamily-domain-containing protein [Mariannaea sp. PMI_226]|nr:thioesterase-like superfamily-domain-containing protein [Mariannaea sp. PMI_226]
MESRPTLLRPPEPDPAKARIENVLDVTELKVLGPDVFTNTRKPWHPPGARGIYGGAVIAQTLAAAQKTVPENFFPHSCHCYFLLAGSDEIPILYHVERVRDGRSFATRTVQARQKGKCIFTTTISFVREDSGGEKKVEHAVPLTEGMIAPPDEWDGEPEWARSGPFQSHRIDVHRGADPKAQPFEKRCRQWLRARGKISAEGGSQAHLNALAYMSDSYFIGTVTRIHGIWRFPFNPEDVSSQPTPVRDHVSHLTEFEGMGSSVEEWIGRPKLGMMVSLDHSIYFHNPRAVRADEWMFTEIESPWSGDGRGLVTQRIYGSDGTLFATCYQEGLVRLKQDGEEKGAKL